MQARWIAVMIVVAACGDDGEAGTSVGTSASTSSTSDGTEESSASGSSSSSSSGGESSSSESSGTGTGTGTGTDPDSSSSSGGIAGDPNYPPVVDGRCADGVPTTLPGGSLCSPFCDGEGAACPDAASGDAVPTCTPFERDGGSGDPCETHDMCSGGEACGLEGTCVAVAFWACQLACSGGETCPDDMSCTSIAVCGY